MSGNYNLDIRDYAKQNGVFLYDVADKLKVSEATFTRRLRRELPDNEKTIIKQIIDEISAARAAAC